MYECVYVHMSVSVCMRISERLSRTPHAVCIALHAPVFAGSSVCVLSARRVCTTGMSCDTRASCIPLPSRVHQPSGDGHVSQAMSCIWTGPAVENPDLLSSVQCCFTSTETINNMDSMIISTS